MTVSALSIIGQIFYEPKAAFAHLKENSRIWLPLLLLPIGSAVMLLWYFNTLDFPWYLEHMMSAQPDMNAEEREAMMKMFTKNSMMMMSVIGLLISVPIIFALYALYYLIASKIMGSTITYGKWFAFAVWTSVPSLLGLPLMALQIASGHGQVAMEDLNMLTLNYLVLHLPPSAPWASFANSLSLTTLWSMFVTFVGLRVWTGRSTFACALTSALPFVVIYGLWIIKIVVFK